MQAVKRIVIGKLPPAPRRVPTGYVLFRINPALRDKELTCREEYVARDKDNSLGLSDRLSFALNFKTARLAYQFGTDNKLLDMKVGYR